MNPSGWPILKHLSRMLVIPGLEPQAQASRVQMIERDIVLPIKGFLIATLVYYFYFSNWLSEAQRTGEVWLETIRYLFISYVAVNLGFAFLIYAKRLAAVPLQWLLFIMGLLDALLLAALIMVTGGYSSILYWVFLVLIIHNAVAIPLATPQIVLNFAVVFFYWLAGYEDNAIKREETKFQTQQIIPVRPHLHGGDTNLVQSITNLNATVTRLHAVTSNWNAQTEVNTNLINQLVKALVLTDETIQNVKHQRTFRNFFRKGEIHSLPDVGYFDPNSPDGTTEPVILRITVLILMSISCYGMQALIERQKRREEESAEFVVRQEQLQTAGRLAAEIAHQIKNPLAIISNAAWFVQRTVDAGKKPGMEQIEIIREEVSRADRIITELMGYAQLAEGRVERMDVIEELDKSLTRVFPAAANYKVEITKDYASGLPPLMMQRGHLAETFVNILQNAREAMKGKGAIHIKAQHGPNFSVIVSIADTGPGIARDHVERVFESYYSTKEKGTGLGLAIVKHNVEIYGGSVRVESELGKGAKFVLQLPAKTLMKLTK